MSLEAAATEAVSESVARLLGALGREDAVLAPALASLDWVASLPNAAAPGFVYLAGACAGLPIGGGGRDLREAAGKLAGETSEILAGRRARAMAVAPPELTVDPRLLEVWGDGPAVAGWNLARDCAAAAPAAAICRDLELATDAPPRSLGSAAGPTIEAARLSGLMELIERDAAGAWWRGETRARAAPVEAAAAASAALSGLRAGAASPMRMTTFLMLPSLTGLPIAAAVSRDGQGQGGLVVGLKAAPEAGAALIGATLELLQMEIGLDIVRLREAQGRPTAEDAATLQRAGIDIDAFEAFAPLPPTALAKGPAAELDAVVRHLAALGIEPVAVDLVGPEGGLAVAKMFAAGLRPMPGPGPAARPGSPGSMADLM